MPKGTRTAVELPTSVKFEVVEGKKFIEIREAAKLAGIHPVVLEMGQRLLKDVGGAGAAFTLANEAMVKKADDIDAMFKTGLKRIAKAFEPNRKIRVKAHRDGNRLVFWYAA